MNKKLFSIIVSLLLIVIIGITGTVAYYMDEDSDVNTFTSNDVEIDQIQQQRIGNKGSFERENLEPFEQYKKIFPAYYPGDEPMVGDIGFEEIEGELDQLVSVKNRGFYDVYLRTVFAFEQGSASQGEFENLLYLNRNMSAWEWETVAEGVEIDGETYILMTAVYTQDDAILSPSEQTEFSLRQFALSKHATADDKNALIGTDNYYKTLVFTQAVQAENFSDPYTALREGFGDVTADSNPFIENEDEGDDGEDSGEVDSDPANFSIRYEDVDGDGFEESILTGYNGSAVNVAIPDGVNVIDYDAFFSNYELKSVVIPDSVFAIRENAFRYCRNLKTVDMPEKLAELGDWVFAGCESLETIEIPAKYFRSVGSRNDYDCGSDYDSCSSEYAAVVASSNGYYDNAEYALWGTFDGCNSLRSVTFNVKTYRDRNEVTGDAYLSSVDIYEDGIVIAGCPFGETGLIKIDIPEGIESLSFGGMYQNSEIEEVTLPSTLKQLYSVYDIRHLKSLTILAKVPPYSDVFGGNGGYYDSEDDGVYGDDALVYEYNFDFGSLDAIYVPDDVVGDYKTTEGWSNYAEFIYPLSEKIYAGFDISYQDVDGDGVQECILNEYTGNDENVVIPEGVNIIKDNAFAVNDSITSVVIPDSVFDIGEKAFFSCDNLASVDMPEKLAVLGTGAFCDNVNLEEIEIPAQYTRYVFSDDQLVGSYVGFNCEPDIESVLNMHMTFSGCTNLKKITFNAKTYADNKQLPRSTYVSSENKYENLYINYAFDDTAIESIVLPEGLREISWNGVVDGSSVSKLTLPSTICQIRDWHFDSFDGVKEITILAEKPPYSDQEDQGSETTGTVAVNVYNHTGLRNVDVVYVPSSSVDAYKEAWSEYADKIQPIKTFDEDFDISVTEDHVILNGYNGTETDLVIPDGVTYIDDYALVDNNITSVVIPASVTDIGWHALATPTLRTVTLKSEYPPVVWEGDDDGNKEIFYESCGHYNIERIYVPAESAYSSRYVNDESYWGRYASLIRGESEETLNNDFGVAYADIDGDFAEETILCEYYGEGGDVEIPNGIQVIAANVFKENQSITSVKIPESVFWIGQEAFAWCENLRSVDMPEMIAHLGSFSFAGSAIESIEIPAVYYRIDIEGHLNENDELLTDGYDPLSGDMFFGLHSFEQCNSLTTVTFNAKSYIDETIPVDLYYEKVTMPRNPVVRKNQYDEYEFEHTFFANCYSLKTLEIPEGITYLANNKGYDADIQVQNLTLPSTIKQIDDMSKFINLDTLTINTSTPPCSSDDGEFVYYDFSFAVSLSHIYVPEDAVETYKTTSGWKDYASIIEAIPTE